MRRTSGGGTEHADVVVVGAGLSGVGAAHRLRTAHPGRSVVVLEAREALGGTWDLFRYPGVRSDSDMLTLGYPFRPWRSDRALADGASIREYVAESADALGVTPLVRFSRRVVAADFDTAMARWRLTVTDPRTGVEHRMTCGFLYACTGYYDYEHPHDPDIDGLADFAGPVVHPQAWPDGLDVRGRRVVVVGSGATAVSLVPALLRDEHGAAHVTMLQRSPSWVAAVPGTDRTVDRLRRVVPVRAAQRVARARNVVRQVVSYGFARRFPRAAGRLLRGLAARALGGDTGLVADHFTPRYDPWDQRLCWVPDGDLFAAVRSARADVVTDRIRRVLPDGVELVSGRVLPADVLVTATGLRLLALGGLAPRVDGVEVDLSEQLVWNGTMVTGLPNLAFCIGYVNASWTLRADLSHRVVCRVLAWADRRGYDAVVPRDPTGLRRQPLLGLTSGYVRRSIDAFPHQGDRTPWRVRHNYLLDAPATLLARPGRSLVPVTADVDGC
ncbi:flavin-containing monooxygenase [Aquipuribacter sp. SD81]|uniref:flavin-containing monooxygenase n=1 Tax=Aquipuribacter sp. SD81 TaxID=3127703 RepID=UPI003018AAB0